MGLLQEWIRYVMSYLGLARCGAVLTVRTPGLNKTFTVRKISQLCQINTSQALLGRTIKPSHSRRQFSLSCVTRTSTGSRDLDILLDGDSGVKVDGEAVSASADLGSEGGVDIITHDLVSGGGGSSDHLAMDMSPPISSVSEYLSPFTSLDPVHVTNLTEPSFTSLGLAHGYPSGWLQTVLELLHIDCGLPWWQTIGLATVLLRCLVFPVMVVAQRNMVVMNQHQPTLQKLQIQQQMCSVRGDIEGGKFAGQAYMNYMSAHNCHPIKTMFPLLTQAAFFTSMFFGLRGMVDAPVESLKTGGLAWFTDLTLQDPTFILPAVACSTIYLQMYLGADGMNLDNMPPIMKKIMYVLPLASIPVMVYFPAALNIYWCTNNVISLVQARVIRRPAIRKKLGIGEMIQWKPEDLPLTTFHEELKREVALQKKKEYTKSLAVAQNKAKTNEQEHKIRGSLLEAFAKEERDRSKPKE